MKTAVLCGLVGGALALGGEVGLATASGGPEQALPQVGLIMSYGNRRDGGFNQAGYEGARRAADAAGAMLRITSAQELEMPDNTDVLDRWVDDGVDLIIAVGSNNAETLSQYAKTYMDVRYAIIDAVVDEPNVLSLVFREDEGAFIAGALAAITSASQQIGVIGGVDHPVVNRFVCGYVAGARHIAPDINVRIDYVGPVETGFIDPDRAFILAEQQFDGGADIIFGVAGASNFGLYDALKQTEPDRYAIGVDLNQNGIVPGRILTSVIKRVDVAVNYAIESFLDGTWQSGEVRLGLLDGGIDWSLDVHNRSLIPGAVESRLDLMTLQLMQGLVLPTTDHPACVAPAE